MRYFLFGDIFFESEDDWNFKTFWSEIHGVNTWDGHIPIRITNREDFIELVKFHRIIDDNGILYPSMYKKDILTNGYIFSGCTIKSIGLSDMVINFICESYSAADNSDEMKPYIKQRIRENKLSSVLGKK